MSETLIVITLVISVITLIICSIALYKSSGNGRDSGKEIRDELRAGRDESRMAGRELREEISKGLIENASSNTKTLEAFAKSQQANLDGFKNQLRELSESSQSALEKIRETLDGRVKDLQGGNEKNLEDMRKDTSEGLRLINEALEKSLAAMSSLQKTQLDGMTRQLKEQTDSNNSSLDRIRGTLDERVKEMREGNEVRLSDMRKEISEGLKATAESQAKTLEAMAISQKNQMVEMTKQLKELTDSSQASLEKIRTVFDSRIKELQDGNEKKLDEMRKTVDEKLHDTLEKRLGESFKLVSDRLESVHKGLGEMQGLASGVGDLKRVLTNVKARGTWAEVQLGALLDQVLTPDQYGKNIAVKDGSSERVEFAIKLPGAKDEINGHLWLPIDSKFPQEDYLRLQEAADRGDMNAVQMAIDALSRRVRSEAKDISEKYISPPKTTDFAILFLATEGLYSEVLRQPTLVEELQSKYHVMVAGPTTLVAILNSLRMGFQTLAIEKRASEVWKVLAAVKTEFGKFGDVLAKVKRQLNTASKTIDDTDVRTRALEKTLRIVEQLPQHEATATLASVGMIVEDGSFPDESNEANGT